MRLPLLLALAAAFAAGCDNQAPSSPSGAGEAAEKKGTGRIDRSYAGRPAPDILFQDPAGEPASVADFRGKPLLLNLWATWCAPCVVEMPSLDALAATNDDIKVLALSQDLNGQEKVDAFFAGRKFRKLEPYLDPELSFMSAQGINTLPTTILYDAQGREVWRMVGMEDWTGERAAELLKEAR